MWHAGPRIIHRFNELWRAQVVRRSAGSRGPVAGRWLAASRDAWLTDLLSYAAARKNKDPKYRTYDSEVWAEFFEEFKNTPTRHRNEFVVVNDGVLIAEAEERSAALEATLSEKAEFPTVEYTP